MYCNSDQMIVNHTYSLMPIRSSKSWSMRKKLSLGCAASTLHYVLSYTTAFENVRALQDENHPGKFHQTVLKSWVFWRLKLRFNAASSILTFHPYHHRRLHCTQLIYCPGTHKSNVSFSVDKKTNASVSLEPLQNTWNKSSLQEMLLYTEYEIERKMPYCRKHYWKLFWLVTACELRILCDQHKSNVQHEPSLQSHHNMKGVFSMLHYCRATCLLMFVLLERMSENSYSDTLPNALALLLSIA